MRHFVEVIGPNPQMKVEGKPSFDIAFEEGEMVSIGLVRMKGAVQRARTLIKRIAFPMFP